MQPKVAQAWGGLGGPQPRAKEKMPRRIERSRGASQGDKHCLQSETKLGARCECQSVAASRRGGAVVLLDAGRAWVAVGQTSWGRIPAAPARLSRNVALSPA